MDETEKEILSKARKLEELEKEYLKYSYECKKPENSEEVKSFLDKALSFAQEAFITRNDIKIELSKITNLAVYDPNVLKTIDKIKTNDKFYSISFYKSIAEMLNKNIDNWNDKLDLSTREYLFSEKYDELFDDFHTWFDVCNYYNAKMSIGAIISSAIVPKKILPYFNEIREAYAFEQLRASIALCRALLEMVLFERLDRLKAFKNQPPQPTSISPENEGNLNIYIRMAKKRKIINGSEVDTAHEIRIFCNQILHLTNKEIKPNVNETFKIIIATVNVIEGIYRS